MGTGSSLGLSSSAETSPAEMEGVEEPSSPAVCLTTSPQVSNSNTTQSTLSRPPTQGQTQTDPSSASCSPLLPTSTESTSSLAKSGPAQPPSTPWKLAAHNQALPSQTFASSVQAYSDD